MGRPRTFAEIIGEEPPDDLYPDEIPEPPPSEFDRDAMQALAVPGLADSESEKIKAKARELLQGGQSREQVGTWICREVAITVGGRAGFEYLFDGDPPHVTASRKFIGWKAGIKRQTRRNKIVDQWVARCRLLMTNEGLKQRQVISLAQRANMILTKRARGEPTPKPPDMRFENLEPLHGRDKLSTPTKERFRKTISAGLRRKSTVPGH